MVPVKLSLKNFLSYGEGVPPLDFTQFHIACLSGNNGHGKSALLDAITWALWGEARKPSSERKPDDALLRVGTTEMRVEFEFDLEEDRYRVIRGYRRLAKGGNATLEFQIRDPISGQYLSLTEASSLSRTQEKINHYIRMDYTTFINSAFILQGRADEFTRKGSRERKEILSNILGLSRYDEMSQLARSHYQRVDKAYTAAAARLEEIERETAQVEGYKREIENLTARITDLEKEIATGERLRGQLQEQRNTLLVKQQRVEEAKRRVEEVEAEVRRIDAQIEEQEAERDRCLEILNKRSEIEEAVRRYEQLKQQDTELTVRLQDVRGLEEERHRLEQVIQEARHEIERRREGWLARLEEAEREIREAQEILAREEEISKGYRTLLKAREVDEQLEGKRIDHDEIEQRRKETEQKIQEVKTKLQIQIGTLHQQRDDLLRKAGKLDAYRQEGEGAASRLKVMGDLDQERERVREQGSSLRATIEGLRERVKVGSKIIAEDEEHLVVLKRTHEAQCPLCRASLTPQRKVALIDRLEAEITVKRKEVEGLEKEVDTLEETRTALRNRYQEMSEQVKDLPTIREEIAQIEAAVKEAIETGKRATTLQGEIHQVEQKLARGEFAVEEQQTLTSLTEEMKGIGYDANRHQAARKAMRDYARFEGEHRLLEDTRNRHKKASEEDVPEARKKVELSTTFLNERRYAQKEQRQLAEIVQKIREIGYDNVQHHEIHQTLEQLRGLLERKADLVSAEQRIETVEESWTRLQDDRERRARIVEELQRQISLLAGEVLIVGDVEREIAEIDGHLQEQRQERERFLSECGGVQAQYDHCLRLAETAERLKVDRGQYERELFIYDHLTRAFGKDGIPALIIENAIPEIEEEANAILARLTDNRTQIAIESLRDLKKGGTRETLDIKISDELGTRSYEVYSGGEAFRTDFSIRIALSKLLAKRAGTKLRTLVIDEGFGTQD
ncbi:MAG: AAA family ATPase, partial [Candidatus Latescibacteria bacterium]|nr:AAA family ATPase [Candidatus Latescibacterota bacterium]